MTRLLVVRLGSLGDLIHTLPAVAAIRRAHPTVEIDWLVDKMHRELLSIVPAVTSVIALGDRTLRAWLEARRALRARRYDVALDFQGLLKSAVLARLSGARRVIGFARSALREPAAARFYTERVDAGEGRHVIEKNLTLAAAVGAAAGDYEFPFAPVDSPVVAVLRERHIAPYALVNPCAAWPNKRWPTDRFGRIAQLLRNRHGLTSVVLWGPGEGPLAQAVVAASDDAAVATPEAKVSDLVALAREARLIVSGDTGPLHIAAAVGTPAIGLFGPTSGRRNGPWRFDDISISRYEQCDCHHARRCRREKRLWCLGSITVDEVGEAIEKRLGSARVPSA
jgi:lipopolysaccharide heptosyltransferase I